MKGRAKFLVYCGLTCFGGSEKRECKCAGPGDCELRGTFDFAEARDAAIDRRNNIVWNAGYTVLLKQNQDTFAQPTIAEIVKRIRASLERAKREGKF